MQWMLQLLPSHAFQETFWGSVDWNLPNALRHDASDALDTKVVTFWCSSATILKEACASKVTNHTFSQMSQDQSMWILGNNSNEQSTPHNDMMRTARGELFRSGSLWGVHKQQKSSQIKKTMLMPWKKRPSWKVTTLNSPPKWMIQNNEKTLQVKNTEWITHPSCHIFKMIFPTDWNWLPTIWKFMKIQLEQFVFHDIEWAVKNTDKVCVECQWDNVKTMNSNRQGEFQMLDRSRKGPGTIGNSWVNQSKKMQEAWLKLIRKGLAWKPVLICKQSLIKAQTD